MTREEAIYILKCLNPNGDMYSADSDEEIEEALIMAIEALEQQPILNEIRAEIEMYEADCRLQGGTLECEKCNDNVFGSIYRIIDKYKVESEE